MKSDGKPLVRRVVLVSLTALLATPLQIVFFSIVSAIVYYVNHHQYALFSDSLIDMREFNSFVMYYSFSLGLLAMNILLCVLLRKTNKIILHSGLLISMFILSAILSPGLADHTQDCPPTLWGLSLFITVPHILTFMHFAVYCAATHLLNKKCKWNERMRTLASSGIALLVGFFISWLAWLIAYSI